MAFKAVLFDMDGVIVDTEPLHRKAYFKMFEDLRIEVSDEFYQSFTGFSTNKVSEILKRKFVLKQSVDELNAWKRKYFKYYFDNDLGFNLLPGVKNLIKNYFENNIKMVLASSASMNTINWVFEKFQLEQYFIGKISGDTLKESKPNPEIFILAAEIANEQRENCIIKKILQTELKPLLPQKFFVSLIKANILLVKIMKKPIWLFQIFRKLNILKWLKF
jgi:beta-phosphoglucomutase